MDPNCAAEHFTCSCWIDNTDTSTVQPADPSYRRSAKGSEHLCWDSQRRGDAAGACVTTREYNLACMQVCLSITTTRDQAPTVQECGQGKDQAEGSLPSDSSGQHVTLPCSVLESRLTDEECCLSTRASVETLRHRVTRDLGNICTESSRQIL